MLFLRCAIAIFVAAAVDVVVIIIVPSLPFVCAIFEIVDWSGVFDEMLICLHLFSIVCVCVWDYYLLAVLVGDDGIRSLLRCC